LNQQEQQQSNNNKVVSVGQLVLCRVLRISMVQAAVEIVASIERTTGRNADPYQYTGFTEALTGIIRKENIHESATEEIEIHQSFRPGDVVYARILSLGDSRNYFLTTSEVSLGVVRAFCSSKSCSSHGGAVMKSVNKQQMECPVCQVKVERKCAKPTTTIITQEDSMDVESQQL